MIQHPEICNSDNYYTNITGDFQNEIIPGRFWVNDTIEAKTVVAKVLSYERDTYIEDSLWLRKGVTIVREDEFPPYSDSVYWADARYMHNLLINAGYIHIDSLSEHYGHDTVDLLNAINDGRSYILYRGVGGNAWSGPFYLYHPTNMNNGFKLPIVISATCATIEGIGKLWLSAGTPIEPKGVVGFFGTTTGLMGAAEMRSALTKGTLENIFTDSMSTLGKAAEAGRLKYFELFNDSLEYDSWNCLGDPEMNVWTTRPKDIDVSHNQVVYAGTCTLFVDIQYSANAMPVESALVCVMAKEDSTIYYYGRTNSAGDIEFIVHPYIPGDTVFFTVTGRNLRAYDGFKLTQFIGGPYVLIKSFSISDTAGGNADSIANPGEDIDLPVWVANWGDATAYDISGVVRSTSPDSFFTISDTVKYFGDIQSLDSVFAPDGYNVIIAPNCPDNYRIELQLIARDVNDSIWISDFDFTAHAPLIQFLNYYFPGFVKYTQPGDTNQLILVLENIGSYKAENVVGRIFSDDSFFVAIDSTSSFGTIPSNDSASNQLDPFTITAAPETPPCYPLGIKLEIVSGVYVDTLNLTIYIGQKDYLIWDPDPNHSSGPIIKAKLDSLNFLGEYSTTTLPYNDYLSLYKSLFVCLGVSPDNYIVSDTSKKGQEIQRYLEVLSGRVYMEGGDVWYGDPHYHHGYDFCQLFNILAVTNWIGSVSHVSGENGTFTQSMVFNYSGEDNSIDRIDPNSGGVLIFRKTLNNLNCGVAAGNRTVGLSFELGGLDDGSPPSTKLVLVDSIMRYFGIPPTGIRDSMASPPSVIPTLAVYPTPFKQSLSIGIQGLTDKKASLKIYDVSGRCVKTFLHNQKLKNQIHNLTWDGRDDHQRQVACGIYFIRIETADYKKVEKAILLK